VPRCKRAFGHVSSTLAIAALAWIVGVAASQRFGRAVDTTASMALVGLGAWIALSSWNDRRSAANAHPHDPIHPRRHEHEAPDHNAKSRPALLLILGSSPMFEGIPAFFAAARYGTALLVAMSLVFARGTIATYVTLSVAALLGLGRVGMGRFERYGEVLSGGFIAFVGLVFAADNGPLSQIQN
jgi:ABC-type nickel/cobalt efflux system permease component RcnA